MQPCSQCFSDVGPCGYCHGCEKRNFYGRCNDRCKQGFVPKSQKVRGMVYLPHIGKSIPVLGVLSAKSPDVGNMSYPVFARPCPIQPRHGFVDSRVVNNEAELLKVCQETVEADPKGEVMLCPFMAADLNAVWTPFLLTIGEGHDGATGGKNTINFPLNGNIPPKVVPVLLPSGIKSPEMPYIEAVLGGDTYALTQLRAGPALKGTSLDYIPTKTVVTRIITVDPRCSLLVWETAMLSVKGEKGVVVYHPGGSPTDHFSIHTRSCGIPLLITKQPVVGETLYPTKSVPIDPHAMLKGIVAGNLFPLTFSIPYDYNFPNLTSRICKLLLLSLHQCAYGGDWWVGFGAAMMMKLGSVALRGEARHLTSNGGLRVAVYKKVVPFSLLRHRAALPRLINTLRYGKFSGSVGGIKWAMCGDSIVKMFDATAQLAKYPTPTNANNLIRTFNVAVNQAHNGGWWLNKFIDQDNFVRAQEGDVAFCMELVPLIHKIHYFNLTLQEETVLKHITQFASWKPIDLSPPRLLEVILTAAPGINGFSFEVEDRLLKKRHRPIIVSVPEILMKLPSMLRGKLFATVTPTGLQIDLIPPHEDPITIWTEEPLQPQEVKA